MTTENETKFKVIKNATLDTGEQRVTNPMESHNSNPYYEKLLKFSQEQERKRFSVEDLLKW